MSKPIEDRRERSEGPPTLIMQSYQDMGTEGRRKMQKIGLGILLFTVAVPMTAGIFVELPTTYWLFSGVGMVLGLCLLWPQLGVWAVNAIPAAVSRLMPSKKLADALRPDRRDAREDGDQ